MDSATFTVGGDALPPNRDHYQRVLNFEGSQARRFGMNRLARYIENRRYFYGDQGDDGAVRMPLGIRYATAVVQKHAHYLWGQWEHDIIDWVVTPALGAEEDESTAELATRVQRAIYYLMRRAAANDKLYKGSLNAGIYGDGIFRVRYKADIQGATFESVLPEYYHAMWDPIDINETNEVVLAFNIDRQTALQRYGTLGNPRSFRPGTILDPSLASVWEWWNPWETMLVIDDRVVYHNPNPFSPLPGVAVDGSSARQPGIIPFIHCPNLGLDGEYWGFGDSEPMHALQDEINLRLADMGDIVSYHSHPITILKNFWGRTKELLVAPDAIWDMGRDGEARYLQWDGPPPQIFEFINTLIQVMLETTNLTPIAFGRSEQSQASGQALQIAMLPITEMVRRKRSQWIPRLTRLALQMLVVEEATLGLAFASKYGFEARDLTKVEIRPRFSPILPRDRLQLVNEVTSRIVNKTISIIRALEVLGDDDPQAEKDRILAELKELAQLQVESQELLDSRTIKELMPNREGGKNSTRAEGGSNINPNPEDQL